MRSGEEGSLRVYGGISGIVDTNLLPFTLDAHGNPLRIHNLYGYEATGGAYGVHRWKRARLGLDYGGDYHRYVNSNIYNGSDQHLSLGYTLQPSRHWSVDVHENAGTYSIGTNELVYSPSSDATSAITPATLLFDSRTTFLQSSAYATYFESARNSFTFGGSGFLQDQKSAGLSNSGGYDFRGSMQRRITMTSTVGASYTYSHYEFPAFHNVSDSNTYHGTFATALGQFWTFSLEAGVTISEVNAQVTFALPPVLAALFGQPSITESSYAHSVYPSGSAVLQRKFRHASLAFNYNRALSTGNGASGTARMDNAFVAYSYTGIRKLNVGVTGGHYSLASVGGENTGTFSTYSGSAGITYGLGRGISVVARYDANQQYVEISNYKRTTTRATLGLLFSPGSVPLALW
jgi:hypothetical protein